MRLSYTKPILNDLSQGSRIAFVRQFRQMTQDEFRTLELSKILNVSFNAIKKYYFRDAIDIYWQA